MKKIVLIEALMDIEEWICKIDATEGIEKLRQLIKELKGGNDKIWQGKG